MEKFPEARQAFSRSQKPMTKDGDIRHRKRRSGKHQSSAFARRTVTLMQNRQCGRVSRTIRTWIRHGLTWTGRLGSGKRKDAGKDRWGSATGNGQDMPAAAQQLRDHERDACEQAVAGDIEIQMKLYAPSTIRGISEERHRFQAVEEPADRTS